MTDGNLLASFEQTLTFDEMMDVKLCSTVYPQIM